VKLIYTHAPHEKVLVFSISAQALLMAKKAMDLNDINSVIMGSGRSSRKALSDFMTRDDISVFLMSLKAGSAGLTLVRANHVILLDLSLNHTP
jgi:SNF2 family DNA or RNA helicase